MRNFITYLMMLLIVLPGSASALGTRWERYTTITTGTDTFHESRGVSIALTVFEMTVNLTHSVHLKTNGDPPTYTHRFIRNTSNRQIDLPPTLPLIMEDPSIPHLGFKRDLFVQDMEASYPEFMAENLTAWLSQNGQVEELVSEERLLAALPRSYKDKVGSYAVNCVYTGYAEDRNDYIYLKPLCAKKGSNQIVHLGLPTLRSPYGLRHYLNNPDTPTRVSVDVNLSAEMRAERSNIDGGYTGEWKVKKDSIDLVITPSSDEEHLPALTWGEDFALEGNVAGHSPLGLVQDATDPLMHELSKIYNTLNERHNLDESLSTAYEIYDGLGKAKKAMLIASVLAGHTSIGTAASSLLPAIPTWLTAGHVAALAAVAVLRYDMNTINSRNVKKVAEKLRRLADDYQTRIGRQTAQKKYLTEVYPYLVNQHTPQVTFNWNSSNHTFSMHADDFDTLRQNTITLAYRTPGESSFKALWYGMAAADGTASVNLRNVLSSKYTAGALLPYEEYEFTVFTEDLDYYSNSVGRVRSSNIITLNVQEILNPHSAKMFVSLNLPSHQVTVKIEDADFGGGSPFQIRTSEGTHFISSATESEVSFSLHEIYESMDGTSSSVPFPDIGTPTIRDMTFYYSDLDSNGTVVRELEGPTFSLLVHPWFTKICKEMMSSHYCSLDMYDFQRVEEELDMAQQKFDLNYVYYLGPDPSALESTARIPVMSHENTLSFPGIVKSGNHIKHHVVVPETSGVDKLLYVEVTPENPDDQIYAFLNYNAESITHYNKDMFSAKKLVVPIPSTGTEGIINLGIQSHDGNIEDVHGAPLAANYNVRLRLADIPELRSGKAHSEEDFSHGGIMVYKLPLSPHSFVDISYSGDLAPSIFLNQSEKVECFESPCRFQTSHLGEDVHIVYDNSVHGVLGEAVDYTFEPKSISVAEIISVIH